MNIVLIKSFSNKPWRSPETYQRIEASLAQYWRVQSIETQDPKALEQFIANTIGQTNERVFVFNIAEYLDENNKQGFIPGFLDQWKIPHLGSTAESILLAMDKAKTKTLLKNKGIPTPQFFIAETIDSDYCTQAEKIGYPLFVKPLNEGGHIGIGEHSICHHAEQLHSEIVNIIQLYQYPALVEEYIDDAEMREFSIGILCGEPAIFTPVEIDFDAMPAESRILSFESAEEDIERIKLINDLDVKESLIKLTQETFNAIGANDYSRVDIRMNAKGYYVLEINVMPGLGPHSFLPEAAESIHGLNYEQLIQRITEHSMRRQQLIN
ncbi:MAG: hypothetical protein FP831_01220 [Anaerolineae bacterium]|nr:hypothetical protein [Anaerolineae bacterium]PKN96789.1 MAG: hypothetical protein CVU43_18890 [Chloroflexi bacterium HGW-Chloroflexi-5]